MLTFSPELLDRCRCPVLQIGWCLHRQFRLKLIFDIAEAVLEKLAVSEISLVQKQAFDSSKCSLGTEKTKN